MTITYYNISEAADVVGVSRPTIYRWITDGKQVGNVKYYLMAVIIHGQHHVEEYTLRCFLNDVGYECDFVYEDDDEDED
jgi:hypothetical protein